MIGIGTSLEDSSETSINRTLRVSDADPFVIRKRIDKSSPYLLRGILQGKVYPRLWIDVETAKGVESSYRLRGVRIAPWKPVS